MDRTPVVDMHAHFLPECFVRRAESNHPLLDLRTERDERGRRFIRVAAYRGPLDERHSDVGHRLRSMDGLGVDIQVISPSPATNMLYWGDAAVVEEVAEESNEALAGIAGAHPDRFIAVGTVPLQDVGRAVRVLERGMKNLGLRGAIIGCHVEGVYLDDERFRPFFECAESLGASLIVHSYRFPDDALLKDYYFENLMGFVFDEGVCVARMIYGGVLERFPRLKVCFVHGGGFFPALIGRWDHGYAVRPECRKAIPHPPSHYAAKLYFDSITHSPKTLALLIEKTAPGHVLMGSDYPFDMGESPPGQHIRELPGLAEGERSALLGGNALRFFRD